MFKFSLEFEVFEEEDEEEEEAAEGVFEPSAALKSLFPSLP